MRLARTFVPLPSLRAAHAALSSVPNTSLQTEQQTLYKVTFPGGADNLVFIQAVAPQEAGSQASGSNFSMCLLHKVSVGITTLYLQTSLPS